MARHPKIFGNLSGPSRGIRKPSWGLPPSLRRDSHSWQYPFGPCVLAWVLRTDLWATNDTRRSVGELRTTAALQYLEEKGRSPVEVTEICMFLYGNVIKCLDRWADSHYIKLFQML